MIVTGTSKLNLHDYKYEHFPRSVKLSRNVLATLQHSIRNCLRILSMY